MEENLFLTRKKIFQARSCQMLQELRFAIYLFHPPLFQKEIV